MSKRIDNLLRRIINVKDFQAKLEEQFVSKRTIKKPTPITIFAAAPETSLGRIFESFVQAAEISDAQREAVSDFFYDGGDWPLHCLSVLLGRKPDLQVQCSNPGGAPGLCGEWSLWTFELGKRGYLFYEPDWGIGEDESMPLLYAWTPLTADAFDTVFLAVYRDIAGRCGLPPYVGDDVIGDYSLLTDAMLTLDDWKLLAYRIKDAVGKTKDTDIGAIASEAGMSTNIIRKAFSIVASRTGPPSLAERLAKSSKHIRRAAIAIYCRTLDYYDAAASVDE